TVSIAIQYLSFALAGFPYMGVGRNLAYKKTLFFQEKGFIAHYQISSGDDDLFINQVARKRNTGIMIEPGASTISEPKSSAGKWVTQKKRHLSTGSHYKINHKFLLGLYASVQILFWIILILLLSWKFAWIVVLSVLLFKWVSQYIVFGRCMSRMQEKDLIPYIPLLEWIILLLNLGVSLSNLVIKPRKWK
ncbi:MAG: glycosyl transferase family 2, partial [Bacteroidia bacterium]|nr:glycosyl transferase family 2 [Bacteroidia bacterium]